MAHSLLSSGFGNMAILLTTHKHVVVANVRGTIDIDNSSKLIVSIKKMLEYDWLLTAFNYGLISFFRSKLSNLIFPITKICKRTGQMGQLSSQ